MATAAFFSQAREARVCPSYTSQTRMASSSGPSEAPSSQALEIPLLAGVNGRPLWVELGAALACLRDTQKNLPEPAQDREQRLLKSAKDTAEVLLFALEGGCVPTSLERWSAYFEGEEDPKLLLQMAAPEPHHQDDEVKDWS